MPKVQYYVCAIYIVKVQESLNSLKQKKTFVDIGYVIPMH